MEQIIYIIYSEITNAKIFGSLSRQSPPHHLAMSIIHVLNAVKCSLFYVFLHMR